MARWINVREPFDFHWPGRHAITVFREADCGDHFVKDEIADFAVAQGYATEGKVDGAARSRKGKQGKRSRRPSKETAPAEAADTGTAEAVGDEDAADADRPADRPPVDNDAG